MSFFGWASLIRRIALANVGALPLPFKLTYVVTKECHSRCVNCKIWMTQPHDELLLSEIEKLARNSPFLQWIDLTGGEPTDRLDLVDIARAFLAHCPHLLFVHFPTNGLKPERVDEVCRAIVALRPPKFVVSVSVDGPPKVNDALRGIKGDFALAMETFRRLRRQKGLDVYMGMTLFPQNAALIDATIAAIHHEIPEFTPGDLHVNLAHRSTHYYGNDKQSPRSPEEVPALLEHFGRRRGFPMNPFAWVERRYQRLAEDYLRTGLCPQDCGALYTSLYLSETGAVYPCSIWDEPIGNIRDNEYSIVPLLQSARAKELRQRLLKKDCPNCWTPCEAYPTLAANLLPLRRSVGDTR